jgi:glutamine amidotransferase
MICVIDYGIGNIQAFLNIFNRLGIEAKRAYRKQDLEYATHLILPGVGNFDRAIQKFNNSEIKLPLQELVFGLKIPLLGVCVGMQMLADGSDEGTLSGLGWIPGWVRAISKNNKSCKLSLPHMGWNDLCLKKNNLLFSNLNSEFLKYYFLHSYYFDAKEKENILATTHYGFDFSSVVSNQNIYGVQFHPEKSHKWGEQLLKNFSKI